MSYVKLLKQFVESINESFVNRNLISNAKPKYDDDVIECMQFGICSTSSSRIKEVPYFHF